MSYFLIQNLFLHSYTDVFSFFSSFFLSFLLSVREIKIQVIVTSTAENAVPTYVAVKNYTPSPVVEVAETPLAHTLYHPSEVDNSVERRTLELSVQVPILQIVSGSKNTCKRSIAAVGTDPASAEPQYTGC